jgi:hypothetical protein
VPVEVNLRRRDSRLFRSSLEYMRASANTMLRIHLLYRPLRTFFFPGAAGLLGGAAIGLRFLYSYLSEGGFGHIQSLILAAILILGGSILILAGLLADLIAANRRLLERTLVKIRELELKGFLLSEAAPFGGLEPADLSAAPAGERVALR